MLPYGLVESPYKSPAGPPAGLRLERERLRISVATSEPYCSASWLEGQELVQETAWIGLRHLLCVILHDDGHRSEIETICLGHQAFSEAVGDMVAAQETRDHDCNLKRDETKDGYVPSLQNHALEIEVGQLAAGQGGSGIAGLGNGGFDKWREIAAAFELALDKHTVARIKGATPLGVYFALEVETTTTVCDVAWDEEECKGDPRKESVDGKEGAVVEKDAGPADEGGEKTEACGDSGENELWPVGDADDVAVWPDIEPGEEGDDKGGERVEGELEGR